MPRGLLRVVLGGPLVGVLALSTAAGTQEADQVQLPQGDADVQRQAQSDARRELEQLGPRIPRLVIHVNGSLALVIALRRNSKNS